MDYRKTDISKMFAHFYHKKINENIDFWKIIGHHSESLFSNNPKTLYIYGPAKIIARDTLAGSKMRHHGFKSGPSHFC